MVFRDSRVNIIERSVYIEQGEIATPMILVGRVARAAVLRLQITNLSRRVWDPRKERLKDRALVFLSVDA
jgi:hypothetical protein